MDLQWAVVLCRSINIFTDAPTKISTNIPTHDA